MITTSDEMMAVLKASHNKMTAWSKLENVLCTIYTGEWQPFPAQQCVSLCQCHVWALDRCLSKLGMRHYVSCTHGVRLSCAQMVRAALANFKMSGFVSIRLNQVKHIMLIKYSLHFRPQPGLDVCSNEVKSSCFSINFRWRLENEKTKWRMKSQAIKRRTF